MASPEVCRALPTMTWSICSGAPPERQPEALRPLVRKREQHSRKQKVRESDGRDAGVVAVHRREDDGGDGDGAAAVPRPQLLVDVAAEGELLVKRSREEDDDDLEPRKS